jgi:hypothetical protein
MIIQTEEYTLPNVSTALPIDGTKLWKDPLEKKEKVLTPLKELMILR